MAASAIKHPITAAVDSRGHWLDARAAGSYLRMLKDKMPAGGIDVFQRTMDEQWAVWNHYQKYGSPRAAYPSKTAPHVMGMAMDFHTTTLGLYMPSAAFKWATVGGIGKNKPASREHLRANDYGWFRTVPSERWHMGYDPSRDKYRKADLAARVKALGYTSTKAFQAAHGLVDDGVDGALTWGALLNNPTPTGTATVPATPAATPDVMFRAASYNGQAKRWGGGTYSADAAFVKDLLRPSVLFMQEAEELCRDAVRTANGFKVWPHLYLGVFWDPTKYDNGTKMTVSLGTPYHGAVATKLTSKLNGESFVACSAHIRPRDAFSSDAAATTGKRADIAKVLAMLKPYPNVVLGGDWSSNAKAQIEDAGYRQVTPYADTYDKAGVQHLDSIFIKGKLSARTAGSIVTTPASDHHGILANLTIPAPVPTN